MSVTDETWDWNAALYGTPEEPRGTGAPVEINGSAGDTSYGLKALASEAHLVAAAPNGQRNDALNRAWFRMGRVIQGGNLTVETARNALADAARSAGLPQHEIDKTLRTDSTSGLAQGARAPRTPATELAPVPEPTVIEPPEPQLQDDFWASRELLTHLHDFARARRVAPWAVLGSTLARVIVTTHPSVALPPIVGGYASLNYFVAIVGRSGTGKGAADAVAREALDFGQHIVTLNTGSGEGAVHAYVKRTKDGLEQHNTAVLFNIPEIDSLGAVGARQGATIISLLRQAWSGEQLGFQYADPTKNLVVLAHKYRMALIAGVQPGRAGTLLDDSDGGLPQRFTWIDAVDRHAPPSPPEAPAPRTLKPASPVVVGASGLAPLEVCQSARDLVDSTRLANLRGELDALDGHAVLARLKTAGALALLERRQEITEEDWQLSEVVQRVSDATRAGILAHRRAELAKATEGRAMAEAKRQIIVSETLAERAVARVARALLRRLDAQGELPWHEARKTLRSSDRVHFDEAIEHLVRAGQVEVSEAENGQRIARIEPKP